MTLFFITLSFAMMIAMNQVITATICCQQRFGGQDSPYTTRLLRILMYYQCLLTFCFHELDVLIETDDALLMFTLVSFFLWKFYLLKIGLLMLFLMKFIHLHTFFEGSASLVDVALTNS